MTKEELLNLGVKYIETHNSYPAAKKWTIKSAGCGRDRIYKTFGDWPNFIKELTQLTDIPKSHKQESYWNKDKLIAEAYRSAEESGYPKYSDFRESSEYPSIDTIRRYFGSWEDFVKEAKFEKPVKQYIETGITKCCNRCKEVKDTGYFYINNSKSDGLSSWCIDCDLSYKKENNHKYAANTARYKAAKLRATPNWGLEGIDAFYKNRPKGYHVDHIVPLQGKNVCGLHVLDNLQYLEASENISKNNKMVP